MIPKKSALIIDDDPAFAQMLMEMLLNLDCEVRAETDPRPSSVFTVRNTEIVFLDLLMPSFSGKDVMAQLAFQETKSPIIVMSGDATQLDDGEKLARNLGLNLVGVLEKPFRLNDVKFILDGIL